MPESQCSCVSQRIGMYVFPFVPLSFAWVKACHRQETIRASRVPGREITVTSPFASVLARRFNVHRPASNVKRRHFNVPPARLQLKRARFNRSEEHTSELQSRLHLVCRLLLEKKKN